MKSARPALVAAALLLGALVAPTSAAQATVEPSPSARALPDGAPRTHHDHVNVSVDAGTEVAVLANDRDPNDPSGATLAICRIEPDENPFDVYPSRGFDESDYQTGGHPVLQVFPFGAEPGTYTFHYNVCDYDYLTPAVLTVKVLPSERPFATIVESRVGFVRFHNPSKYRTQFQFGPPRRHAPITKFVVKAGNARTVRVPYTEIFWAARYRTRDSVSYIGSSLSGIPQPRGRAALHDRQALRRPTLTVADRTTWRLAHRQLELSAHPATASSGAAPSATRDESTDAPVTGPDTLNVSQGWFSENDVLANDTDPDGDAEDLAVCRAVAPAGSGLVVQTLPFTSGYFEGPIVAVPGRAAARRPVAAPTTGLTSGIRVIAGDSTKVGTYKVTYYACDRQYLTPATVTVHVTPSQRVVAHLTKTRAGVVRFTNPGPYGARIHVYAQGRRHSVRRMFSFGLAGHSSKNVRPHSRRIFWFAESQRGPGGSGEVRGIAAPRG